MTPVLMTALSAGLALIPLMIDASAPGKEILHPVAVTIFGGLVSATISTRFSRRRSFSDTDANRWSVWSSQRSWNAIRRPRAIVSP